MRHLSWFAVATGLLLAAAAPPQALGVAPVLTAELRRKIDETAMATPLEPLSEQGIALAGRHLEWIVSQVPASAEDEARISGEIHAARLGRRAVLPVPASASQGLQKLIDALPERMKPDCFRFGLTVEASPERTAHTPGGGFVWITRSYLDAIEAQQNRDAVLAFVLGHELGHVCLGHTASAIQAILLPRQMKTLEEAGINSQRLQTILGTRVDESGGLIRFTYVREKEHEADLFALHLCRNAGIDPEAALDALRLGALLEPSNPPRAAPAEDALAPPRAVLRLKRLKMELGGLCGEESSYGLLEFSKEAGTFCRAADGRLSRSPGKAVVFVHGMAGNRASLAGLMRRLAAEEDLRASPFLAFEYPNRDSLAKCGALLHQEMRRVFGDAIGDVDFVCHSAGGLVFRHYAETLDGKFGRAVFLATPHGGSSLASLQPLVGITSIWAEFSNASPVPRAVQKVILDGKGQIRHDLEPESLFLRYLRQKQPLSNRYTVFRGQVMESSRAFFLRAALGLTTSQVRGRIPDMVRDPALQAVVGRWVDRVVLPDEVAAGDGVVSLHSAALEGAAIHDTRCDHLSIREDPQVVDAVLGVLRTD